MADRIYKHGQASLHICVPSNCGAALHLPGLCVRTCRRLCFVCVRCKMYWTPSKPEIMVVSPIGGPWQARILLRIEKTGVKLAWSFQQPAAAVRFSAGVPTRVGTTKGQIGSCRLLARRPLQTCEVCLRFCIANPHTSSNLDRFYARGYLWSIRDLRRESPP